MQLLLRRRFALFQQEAVCPDHSQELLSDFPVLPDGQNARGAEVSGDDQDARGAGVSGDDQDEMVYQDARGDVHYHQGA